MVQLVEALPCKLGGRGYYSGWVIEVFHWLDHSGRTMAVEAPQPLTEMSAKGLCCGVNEAGA